MFLELAGIIGGLVANFITSKVKPAKGETLTQEALDARKTLIRVMNLVFGIVGMVVTVLLIPGEQIDTTTLSGNLETLFAIILTFGFQQGAYALKKG